MNFEESLGGCVCFRIKKLMNVIAFKPVFLYITRVKFSFQNILPVSDENFFPNKVKARFLIKI